MPVSVTNKNTPPENNAHGGIHRCTVSAVGLQGEGLRERNVFVTDTGNTSCHSYRGCAMLTQTGLIHMCIHVCVYIYIYMYVYIYKCVCTYIYIYIHIHIHTHIHLITVGGAHAAGRDVPRAALRAG